MVTKRKKPSVTNPPDPDRDGDRRDPPVHRPEDLHDRIASLAYEIYERRRCQGALDDWLEAERQVQQQR